MLADPGLTWNVSLADFAHPAAKAPSAGMPSRDVQLGRFGTAASIYGLLDPVDLNATFLQRFDAFDAMVEVADYAIW